MTGPVEFDVFISYADEDLKNVLPIVERLRADGFTVWLREEQLPGNRADLIRIADAIAHSAQTVAFCTDAYLLREQTSFELKAGLNRDLENPLDRTVPVRLAPLTRPVPTFLRHLTMCDLSGPDSAEPAYAQIATSLRQHAPHPKPGADAQTVAQACEAPLQYLGEPEVALFLIRQAADALARYLYRRELGEPEPGSTLEALHRALVVSGKIPAEIAPPLALIRTFGNFVVHDQAADQVKVTEESIEPALAALRTLTAWAFPDRPRDDRLRRAVAVLPRIGGDSGELQIPGTNLRLREPQLGRTALGPIYAGRDTAAGSAVSVVLVDLPAERESAFLELIGQYAGLTGTDLVVPLDAGPVDAGGGRWHYVVFPAIGEISARELADRHGGRLPAGAAYEIGLGLTRTLTRLHGAQPPLTYGVPAAADVLLSRFGSVRLRCPGRDADSAEADLQAVPELLDDLLADRDAATGETLRRLADCRSALQMSQLLAEARRRLPAEPDLRSLLRGLGPAAGPAAPGPQLIESYPVAARRAWPLGEGRVLIWEHDTETLAVLDGPRVHWRDAHPVPVRLSVSAAGQVAVGGWDGSVRFFAGGEPVNATRLDGAVGDLEFVAGGLVAGSWRHALVHLDADRQEHALLEVPHGVHRIAAGPGDRFAVADLSGRIAVYHRDVRVRDWRQFDTVADLAFAGPRLVLLTEGGLTSLCLDERADVFEPKPGASRLLPVDVAGTCQLLVAADPRNPGAGGLQVWSVDQEDRHMMHTVLPPGYRFGSACRVLGRLTVELPGGGCAYWRDETERRVWPDATVATLAPDGEQIAVCLPDRVELYAEAP